MLNDCIYTSDKFDICDARKSNPLSALVIWYCSGFISILDLLFCKVDDEFFFIE